MQQFTHAVSVNSYSNHDCNDQFYTDFNHVWAAAIWRAFALNNGKEQPKDKCLLHFPPICSEIYFPWFLRRCYGTENHLPIGVTNEIAVLALPSSCLTPLPSSSSPEDSIPQSTTPHTGLCLRLCMWGQAGVFIMVQLRNRNRTRNLNRENVILRINL